MRKTKNFPLLIQETKNRLFHIFQNNLLLYGRNNHYKRMRPERQQAVDALLKAMVSRVCLAFDGAIMQVHGDYARPATLIELAKAANLSFSRAKRALEDLRRIGLVASSQQIKRRGPGGLEVSPVLRQFTKLFWEMLNLWSLFVESVKYAATHTKKRLSMLFKRVSAKIGDASTRAKNKLFMDAMQCYKRKGGRCSGFGNNLEICITCKRYNFTE